MRAATTRFIGVGKLFAAWLTSASRQVVTEDIASSASPQLDGILRVL